MARTSSRKGSSAIEPVHAQLASSGAPSYIVRDHVAKRRRWEAARRCRRFASAEQLPRDGRRLYSRRRRHRSRSSGRLDLKSFLLGGAAALALARLRNHQQDFRHAPQPRRPPRPRRRRAPRSPFPTTSCSPTGPAPMTAFRPGTRSSPSCSPRRSSSGSTSSAARCWRSPTVPTRRPSPTRSRRSRRPASGSTGSSPLFGVMTDNMTNSGLSGAREGMVAQALRRVATRSSSIPKLFQRVKAVYEARESAGLDAKQQRLVTRLYDSFVRRGANLDARAEAAALRLQSSSSPQKFADLRREGAGRREHLHRRHRGGAEGRPRRRQGRRRLGRAGAQAARRQLCDRQHPLGGRSDPDLRRQSRACARRCGAPSSIAATMAAPTTPTRSIAEIVKLRADRARLLGFSSHADWRMQDTMAKTPAKALRPDEARLAGRGRPGEGGGRRHAGARPQDRPRPHHRALGLSLLSGEGPQAALQPHPGRGEALFRAEQHHRGIVSGRPASCTGSTSRRSPARCRSGIRTSASTASPTGATGKQVGVFYRDDYARTGKRSGAWATDLSQPRRPARRRHRARLEQQQFRQAGAPASRC